MRKQETPPPFYHFLALHRSDSQDSRCFFFGSLTLFSKIIATFAPASPTPSRPQLRNGVVEKGRSTTYWKVFANACFWPLEPRKFERASQKTAEVDAAGRYYVLSRRRAEG